MTGCSSLPDGTQATEATVVRQRPSLRDHLHLVFVDHGFLRWLWHNTEEIAPGVWRSNQPDRRRLRRWKKSGIRSVLSLRGDHDGAVARIERAACAELGLGFSYTGLSATSAPRREVLLDLFARFRRIERPFVMHCKSGADRTGLAATLYMVGIEGQPTAQARRQLSLRFMHSKWTRAGVIDHLFDLYEARQAESPIGIEDWIAQEYDPAELTRSFARRRGR